jgi:hypothetical protein
MTVKRSALTKDMFGMRILLVLGVLLGLCLSEGVGLQLLPSSIKESTYNPLAVATQIEDFDRCSGRPSRSEFTPRRTEIIAPKLKNLSSDRLPVQTDAAALGTSKEFQRLSVQSALEEHIPSAYSLKLACRTAGRAPPRMA